jgi:MFS family permease
LHSETPHVGDRPATFREVFAVGEFRTLYAASALSWFGDYLARAAVTALVYTTTGSVVYSAAAFAISYAPWLLGGTLLVSLAERYPYRSVMVSCDLARMAVMGAVAIPGLHLPEMLGLLLLSAVLTPPFEAARSATLPAILPGDRYAVGLAVMAAASQPAQVTGYLAGAALAVPWPHLALLVNAVTFGVSAMLIHLGIPESLPEGAATARRSRRLMRETAEGFRLVFSRPALRSLALVTFAAATFAVVPEGLAAAWSNYLVRDSSRGLIQGMIMAAGPLGLIIGGLSVTRLASPQRRARLLRPLALAAPLMLVPALFNPAPWVIVCLAAACGFAVGGLVPVANSLFGRAVPPAYRTRAFGVMQAGLALLQGGAVLVTGALANLWSVPLVVGLWALAGLALTGIACLRWPAAAAFADAAVAATAEAQLPRQHGKAVDDAGVTRIAAPQPGLAAPGTIDL